MKNKKVVKIILIIALISGLVFMEYVLHLFGKEAYSNVEHSLILSLFDVILGAIIYCLGILTTKGKKRLRVITIVVGVWNFCGGILLFIVSMVRFLRN